MTTSYSLLALIWVRTTKKMSNMTVEDILEMIAEEKNAWGYGTDQCKSLEQLEKRIRKATSV
jgi:hypothetical protein